MVTIIKLKRKNEICFTIQLTLWWPRWFPSVSTADRLSVYLGLVPKQYLMLLPHPEPDHLLTWRWILMQARWNVIQREPVVNGDWITRSPLSEVHYSQAIQDFRTHSSFTLLCEFVYVYVCVCVWFLQMFTLTGSKQSWWAALGVIRGRRVKSN